MLKNLLKERNKTLYMLSKECGIAYSTLHYIINERTSYQNCTVQNFKKLADALGMSMNELYEECQKSEQI